MTWSLYLLVLPLVAGFPFDIGPTTFNIETTPAGCFYNGRWYSPGVMISQGQMGNWCYFTLCDISGNMMIGDNFNCQTTVSTTTADPSHIIGK
ncbi:hypothetical protein ACJMK2_032381 [Sinanodonta woodiana]|uniref:Uncharacterized protein n=1 Tax=Sinanodonta woodiana TaxID=1069815 RepID=A0ABD3X1K1_SINWO